MRPDLDSILFQALQSKRGIKVRVENAISYRGPLYAARRSNPLFKNLSFIVHSPTELWIVKTGEVESDV